jgi:hypothetical protein
MRKRSALIVATVTTAFFATGMATVPAEAATAKRIPAYKNCTALNKVYKHGIGRKGAKDKVASGKRPVTTFLVSNQGYLANKKLDRDKDGIACEKR